MYLVLEHFSVKKDISKESIDKTTSNIDDD